MDSLHFFILFATVVTDRRIHHLQRRKEVGL